ncbi:magnesium transporter [Rubinisphaera margarita]|uniref:magnesium transporter n=1 Tax=Rubinisphaera margarita TaxID=2909586 RepID=UPI001EE93AEC|nr:magnesium transporter [Rubinisphaera margarita]MCG6156762.1 magnesium transporter [Rubinisphaera margarita]
MYNTLLLPDLRLMLIENDEQAMKEFCEVLIPAVSAELLAELTPAEALLVLSKVNLERRAEIFGYLPLPFQVLLVGQMDRSSLSRLIEEMAADDRVDLLECLDPGQVETLLPLIAQAERADIRKLLSYPEGSAGSIMTTEYASLPKDITVRDAFERLRVQAPDRETIYYIYIIDDKRRLLGFLSMRKLILAKPNQLLVDIMQQDVISVRVDDDDEFVANELNRYGFIAIPVVDSEQRLVGIVTHDDAADVLREEAEEDQHRLAAVEPLEDSYLSTSVLILAQKRGVWLFFLLGAAVLTAWVLQFFEGSGEQSWIIMFLPLVLASGGNAGSQSAALVISALAREHSRTKRADAVRILSRELALSGILGGSVAFISFFCAWLLTGSLYPATVVSLTVLLVVVMAAVTGAALPIIVQSFDADPAYMSTPLIAAMVDVIGVIIYFNVAYLVFGHYPH